MVFFDYVAGSPAGFILHGNAHGRRYPAQNVAKSTGGLDLTQYEPASHAGNKGSSPLWGPASYLGELRASTEHFSVGPLVLCWFLFYILSEVVFSHAHKK